MTVIRIQQDRAETTNNVEDPFSAVVRFDHGVEYPITVRNPFNVQEEQRLEWYFEEYLRFPFLRQKQAQQVAASIKSYGEALFAQVFADPGAQNRYRQARTNLPAMQFEIAGSPAFHALHWEALTDPNLPRSLSLDTTFVRRNLTDAQTPTSLRSSPTINLLVVAARPHGKQDMGYRIISRPLIEVLRRTNMPVQIEILRPGAYQALENHLRAVTTLHGPGYYHVIHFDLHGAVLSFAKYQQVQQAFPASSLVYQDRYAQASTYHQLGRVAEEQHQFEQAEQYYQQALQLKIEFNDRYSQASTYHNLGMVAGEQRQLEQAEQYYQQALQIYVEYKDTRYREMTLSSLARFWKESTNEQLPATVAQILRVNVAEVESMWQDVLESHTSEKNTDDEKS